MSGSRLLHPEIIQVDIRRPNGETVAMCTKVANGSWIIRSLEDDWHQEVNGPLQVDQLVEKYKEIRKIRRAAKKARLESERERK